MKKLISVLLAALTLVCCLGLAACSSTSGETADGGAASDGSESSNVFRVGMECNYTPYNWAQTSPSDTAVAYANGYADGYDVQIAKRIADGLGKELEIVQTEWDGLIPALNSGKVDAVIAGMSATEERKLSVDFSDNYYESQLVMVVRKDGPYADADSLSDFAGARITGQLNTFHYGVIDQIEGVNKQTAMETFPAMVVALNSGKIDGYVSERPGAISAVTANPDLTYVEFAEGQGFVASPDDTSIAVAVKKGNTELLEQINGILAEITPEEREELMNQAVENQPLSEE